MFEHLNNLHAIDLYLSVNDARTKYEINEVRKLQPPPGQKITVRGLQTYFDTYLAITFDGRPITSENAIKDCYLVLVNGDEQVLDTIALQNLVPQYYNGRRFFANYEDIDWTRSYIMFGRTSNLPAVGSEEIVQITVFYTQEAI